MEHKPIVLHNAMVISESFRFIGSVIFHNGIITNVVTQRTDPSIFPAEHYDVRDCSGLMLLPGIIDTHVHFRQPGFEEKGTMQSESIAALAGGVTSIFDMPNTLPPTTSIEAWEEKMHLAYATSATNYAFFMGATATNMPELLAADYTRVPGVKLFMGSTTGSMLLQDHDAMCDLFKRLNHVIVCHAEDDEIIRQSTLELQQRYPDGIPVGLHHQVRPPHACIEATRKAVELALNTGARLHVAHITTADELQFFSPGDITAKRITAETCPHYLWFTQESVERTGGLTKCNPAIKTEADRRALLEAVADGRINIVASDHAPHQLALKQGGNALTTASGMPSVQYILPLMMQMALNGNFPIETVVERMAAAPARLYGISRRGFIRPNYFADLVLIDPDYRYTITNDDILSNCGWSPYEGVTLRFRVLQTWVNGSLAYDEGMVTNDHTPLPIRFDA